MPQWVFIASQIGELEVNLPCIFSVCQVLVYQIFKYSIARIVFILMGGPGHWPVSWLAPNTCNDFWSRFRKLLQQALFPLHQHRAPPLFSCMTNNISARFSGPIQYHRILPWFSIAIDTINHDSDWEAEWNILSNES